MLLFIFRRLIRRLIRAAYPAYPEICLSWGWGGWIYLLFSAFPAYPGAYPDDISAFPAYPGLIRDFFDLNFYSVQYSSFIHLKLQ